MTSHSVIGFVHHVSLRVDDIGAALVFYRDLLGLTPIERPDLGVPGVWLQLDAVQIHLIQCARDASTGSPPDSPNPLACHLAFEVRDIDLLVTRLRAAGLEPVAGHPDLPQCFVQDPSGNVIEFTTAGRSSHR